MKSEKEKSKDEKHTHISSYTQSALVLITLLFLTFITVWVATLHLASLAILVALVVATIKGTIVISYFMHLKYENLFIKLMVLGVFLLFALVVIITFIDYYFR